MSERLLKYFISQMLNLSYLSSQLSKIAWTAKRSISIEVILKLCSISYLGIKISTIISSPHSSQNIRPVPPSLSRCLPQRHPHCQNHRRRRHYFPSLCHQPTRIRPCHSLLYPLRFTQPLLLSHASQGQKYVSAQQVLLDFEGDIWKFW